MDKKDKKKNNLQGFKTLKLRYSDDSSAFHELFLKEHVVRNQTSDKPAGRTLFVLNVPQYVTADNFKTLFKNVGNVTSVIFQAKPSAKNVEEKEDTAESSNVSCGFKVAYIIFSKANGLTKALNLESLPPLTSNGGTVLTGINKWIKDYNRTIQDPDTLQKEVDKFMEHYDEEEEQAKRKEKQTVVDEEGWTTVTRTGRKPGFARKESVNKKIMDKIKMGKKHKELKNFYTFQIRESKQNKIAELRKKYEEDKMKISKMKQARKFKPY